MLVAVIAVFVVRAAALQTFDTNKKARSSAQRAHPTEDYGRLAYRWPTPDKSGMGPLVSDHVAMRLAGPATLLHLLNVCRQNPALKQRLDQVHKRGELRLHIIGSSDVIEPKMAWPGLLRGWSQADRNQSLTELVDPHLPENARTLTAEWGLSSAFENDRLNILFNGFAGVFTHNEAHAEATCRKTFEAANQDSLRSDDSVACVNGLYDKIVSERGIAGPDVAIMMNAGLATKEDIDNWRSTLAYLADHDVPTIVTNYAGSEKDPFLMVAETAHKITQESTVIGGNQPDLIGIGYRSSSPTMDCTVAGGQRGDLHQLELLGINVIASGSNPFFWLDSPESGGLGNGQYAFFQGRAKK